MAQDSLRYLKAFDAVKEVETIGQRNDMVPNPASGSDDINALMEAHAQHRARN